MGDVNVVFLVSASNGITTGPSPHLAEVLQLWSNWLTANPN
jgi:hypothetical protein